MVSIECMICCDDIEYDQITKLDCRCMGIYYHKGCIRKWFWSVLQRKGQVKCPYCLSKVKYYLDAEGCGQHDILREWADLVAVHSDIQNEHVHIHTRIRRNAYILCMGLCVIFLCTCVVCTVLLNR